jgi:FKBP-type peptidyl-prolyl cis-trans isomerase
MRAFALPAVLAALVAGPALADPAATPSPAAAPAPMPELLKTPEAQDSYLIGLQVGQQLRGEGILIQDDVFVRGVEDALKANLPLLTDEQMQQVTDRLHAEIAQRREARRAQLAAANLAAGQAYLKANGAKPGVVTLPSGLQYEVLKAGTGPIPKATDTVVCNYRGTLIDGTEFDGSERHGGPSDLRVNALIKGWTEALQRMPVGSKWRIVLPAELGYGAGGAGPAIGPSAVLVFEVELLSIQGS